MKPVIWMGNSKADLVAFPEEVRREIGYQLEHVQEGLDPDDWKPYRGVRGTRNSRSGIVRSFPLHLPGDAAGGNLYLALFPKEDAES